MCIPCILYSLTFKLKVEIRKGVFKRTAVHLIVVHSLSNLYISYNTGFNSKILMKKRESNRNQSTVQEVNLVIPSDGGYAWIIVFAAFMSNVAVDGIVFSFSVALLPKLSEALSLPTSKVAVIGSVQLGTYYLVGPVACAFVNHYGFRAVGVCGCVIAFAGIFITSHIESFPVIITLYGVIVGIGFGMIYTAAVISVGYYFEKYRALATGISVCGSSVGGLCLSPLFAHIVKSKGWEFTMKIQSFFVLVSLIASLAYRPLKPTTRVPLTQEIIEEMDQLRAPSRVEFVELFKTNSMISIDLDDHSEESRHFPQISIISSRFLPITECKRKKRKLCSCSSSWIRNLCWSKRKQDNEKLNVIATGPLDRKDIFYSHSVLHLPQYKVNMTEDSAANRKTLLSYRLSMILDPKTISSAVTPNSRIQTEPDHETCFGISHLIHKALGNLFDVSLLKSLVFCVLALACLCYSLAWMTPYMYLPNRGESNEISKTHINWFISYISFGNAIGRILSGVLATIFSQLNSCYLVGCTTISAGIVTLISAFVGTKNVYIQIGYCIVYGFCIAFLSALRPIVFVKLLGLDKLTNAFGLSAVVLGLGLLSGTPIASTLFEKTGMYMPAFVLAGSLLILSGMLIIVAFHVYLWQEKNKK